MYSIIQATIEDLTMSHAEATTTSAILFAVKAISHNQIFFDPSKNRERKRSVLIVIKAEIESVG